MMKQNLKINGKSYEIQIDDLMSSPIQVTVDGKNFQVEVEQGSAAPVKVVAAAAAPVSQPVAASKPAAVAAAPSGPATGNEIRAPMPGKILKVAVKVGDHVTRGQEVVHLEAMKMRNIIRATQDGVVSSVEVSVDQKVAHNAVLVRIE
jgi:glutaconyl-CoA decarboxylase